MGETVPPQSTPNPGSKGHGAGASRSWPARPRPDQGSTGYLSGDASASPEPRQTLVLPSGRTHPGEAHLLGCPHGGQTVAQGCGPVLDGGRALGARCQSAEPPRPG